MTNFEKYKTAMERAEAFYKYCKTEHHTVSAGFAFRWLDLEAEYEKLLPCPFCGQRTEAYHQLNKPDDNSIAVFCTQCSYRTMSYSSRANAIEAHNRVAKAR